MYSRNSFIFLNIKTTGKNTIQLGHSCDETKEKPNLLKSDSGLAHIHDNVHQETEKRRLRNLFGNSEIKWRKLSSTLCYMEEYSKVEKKNLNKTSETMLLLLLYYYR
jgi:arsenate reductase-like glutaredoxin family protein